MTASDLGAELRLGPEGRELVAGLLALGVPPEDIRRAAEHGRLEDAMVDQVLDPDRERRTVSAADVEARGGLTVEATRELMRAFGLPAPEPDDPFLTDEEAKAFTELGRLSELWPAEIRQEIARVYGRALTRIAQTEVHLFRSRVEPWIREITESPLDALAAVRQAFGWLLPLTDPLLVGVHRRKLEQELTQAAVWEVETQAEGALPGSREVSLLFCDLTGFTAYADRHGDAAAIEIINRFANVVDEHRGAHGRFVKRLGDGYMLAYPEPREAVEADVQIATAMREEGEIDVHSGIHHGVAVFREGDYFGRAVNLAARLLSLASAGEILATEAVAGAAPDYPWRRRGTRRLRGFADPLEIYALELGSHAPEIADSPS